MGVVYVSADGRITIDALFHDRDGTAAISVLSLGSTVSVTGGIVSVVDGVASTDATLVDGSGYRDASGSLVMFGSHELFVVSATGTISVTSVAAPDGLPGVNVADGVSVLQNPAGGGADGLYVSTFSGTARYSIMFIGQ